MTTRRGKPETRAAALGAALLVTLAACEAAPGPVEVTDVTPAALDVFGQTADPSLAVDPASGDLLMTWVAESDGEWNLLFARSADGGSTFSAPVRVNDASGDVYPHAEGSPRLVAAPGVAAVFWNNQVEAPTRVWGATDLRYSRTTDGGKTWEAALTLQDPRPGAIPPGENTFHGATWAGDSTLVVAWLDGRERDERHIELAEASGVPRDSAVLAPDQYADVEDPHDGDATIYAAVSHDLGGTWDHSNRRVQGGICPCCRVGMAGTPAGDIVATWRQHFGTNIRDPAFRSLLDTTSAPIRVHEDNWSFPGCPHAGPALDVDGEGDAHVVWYTGAEGRMGLHYARKAAAAAAFEAPVPIAVGPAMPVSFADVRGLDGGGALVAHNVDATGRRTMMVSRVDDSGDVVYTEEVARSANGTHPQLALVGEDAIVAWTESEGGVQSIRVFRLSGVDR